MAKQAVNLLGVKDVAELLHCSRAHAYAVMDKAGCYDMGTGRTKKRVISEARLWDHLNSTVGAPCGRAEQGARRKLAPARGKKFEFAPVPGNPMGCIVPKEALARPKRQEA